MEPTELDQNIALLEDLKQRGHVYKQSLTLIYFMSGMIGLVTGSAINLIQLEDERHFILIWMSAASLVVLVNLSIINVQAIKNKKHHSPMIKLGHFMIGPLLIGALIGTGVMRDPNFYQLLMPYLLCMWSFLYGLGLIAASFVLIRGTRVLGWTFILCGGLILFFPVSETQMTFQQYNLYMATTFGGLHLAQSVVLLFQPNQTLA